MAGRTLKLGSSGAAGWFGVRAAAIAATLLLSEALPAAASCDQPPERVEIAAALGGGSFRLKDGREIVLAGVEPSPAAAGAIAALARSRPVTIRTAGKTGRWGRIPAHVEEVEAALVRRGLGHVAAKAETPCLDPLYAAEADARAARAGIWAERALAARDGEALLPHLGRHIIAEGEVVSARPYQGRVYVNFARYWRSGLSLIIAEKDWPSLVQGKTAESLVGRRLRVRGHLEFRTGPAILARPGDRIEVVDPQS